MEDNAEEDVLRQLKWENRMLKQRVFELEEKQKGGSPSIRGEHKPDSGVGARAEADSGACSRRPAPAIRPGAGHGPPRADRARHRRARRRRRSRSGPTTRRWRPAARAAAECGGPTPAAWSGDWVEVSRGWKALRTRRVVGRATVETEMVRERSQPQRQRRSPPSRPGR